MARATVIDKTNFLSEQIFPLSSETSVNLLKMKNKDYYRLLINTKKKNRTQSKNKVGSSFTPWNRFSVKKFICKDNKLREFYFKLLHRIIVTKKELFLYGIKDDMLYEYCQMNDLIIHTLQNCTLTKQFFSEVIKWFNNENATSLRYSQVEILFGGKFDDKNVDSYFVKKLDFTLLYVKYYLYNQKVLYSEISMIDFVANLNQKYSLEGLSM